MSDDDKFNRTTPPEDHEWPIVYSAIEKANKAWIVVGPIHAIVTNWKFLLGAIAAAAWINRPEIVSALSVLIGGAP